MVVDTYESQNMAGDLDATRYLDCFLVKTKSADDMYRAFQEFTGLRDTMSMVHTRNSQDLSRPCRTLELCIRRLSRIARNQRGC